MPSRSSIFALMLYSTGDHKQLRPKVEQYELRVESGRGFDLNVSLFERLVKESYPFCTLELQHRMPPEVSGAIHVLLSRRVTTPGIESPLHPEDYPYSHG